MSTMLKRIGASLLLAGLFAVLLLPVGQVSAEFDPLNPAAYKTNFGTQQNLASEVSLITAVKNAINWAMGLLGLIAVIVIIWAGFLWMTAGGNEDQLKKAKDKVIQGCIGLVMIVSAWSIAGFVLNTVAKNFLNASSPSLN